MHNPLRLIAIISLLLHISGCSYYIVSFADVSNESPYSKVINLTFKTKSELIIYGYNLDSIPGKEIHEYSITPPPGPKNRYVLSRNIIPSDSIITSVAVKRCEDCFLDITPRIKIEITSDQLKDYKLPIYIDGPLLICTWGENGEGFQLNTEYFVLAEIR
jgi:hypothetical protein